ncbi:KPN_02809 family neutral zinc metallopeptidase [Sphingobacterium sp. MYb382]|uniref:KPN_02809 family neutral zinc metallopeptidase n=1 Tax=Sphingobacterium sp. MYb382 TaxID=2745278 RepID=UPI0030B46ACD
MKWQGARRGGNIEDRRGMSGGQKLTLGGIGGIVVLLISFLLGGDPAQLLQQVQESGIGTPTNEQGTYASSPEEDKLVDYADVVIKSTEEVWTAIFKDNGKKYPIPALVLYNGATETAGCGVGKSQFGPFYCPGDQKIYLDLSFNKELQERYGAKGEFALAYVIAHEVGHHIQNLLGVLSETNALRAKMSEKQYNKISVMTELQADFYAGVWAHHLKKYSDIELTYDDIVDGMRAAAAVGDDHLQEQAYGKTNPESFTHGTSQQRMYWFKKGYDTGNLQAGNTFDDPSLK